MAAHASARHTKTPLFALMNRRRSCLLIASKGCFLSGYEVRAVPALCPFECWAPNRGESHQVRASSCRGLVPASEGCLSLQFQQSVKERTIAL
jgi:hypothetical protein